MATPEHKETEIKSRAFNLRHFFANGFRDFLTKETKTLYNLNRIKFDVQSESKDPEGVKHVTITPFEAEEVQDFDTKGFFLVICNSYDHAYLIEFSDADYYDSPIYFIGINRVPNPNWTRDKGEWGKDVINRRVRPPFYKQAANVLPSLGIILGSSEEAGAKLYGSDLYLGKFFESLNS